MTDRLDDLLSPGLRIVFCGTAAGNRSAKTRTYYAGPGNRFWTVIRKVGLVTETLGPADFRRASEFKIGFTDLAKAACGMDSTLVSADFDLARFWEAMARHRPQAVAFTSKAAGSIALGIARQRLAFGRVTADSTPNALPCCYVLPSPSGANAHWSKLECHWQAFANEVGVAAA